MVTLKIAGIVVALLTGLGFTPTFLDYLPLGRALRRGFLDVRANPSFIVGAVLACASLIPITMLAYALLTAPATPIVVVGFVVVFVVAALGAVVVTPAPKRIVAAGPPQKGYYRQFMQEE